MQNGWRVVADLGLGVLRARGADTRAFLQGQLSNDVMRLEPGRLQLSGYHTPQGRTIALLRLTALAADDVLAVLPRELVTPVLTRLKRYVLRARVQLTDDSAQWTVLGYQGPAPAVPAGALCLPYDGSRQLMLIPGSSGPPARDAPLGTAADWAASDIAAGLPQVFVPTSEAFVAQMLNLDLTGGIALDKGCYTGQEIIARAHYRGQVKRRMQRFVTLMPGELTPGQTGVLTDGRSFRVVQAALQTDGHCAFLAVTNPESVEEPAVQGETVTLLAARQLALPYELPAPRT
jgi:folate-binding protein YgfZ